MYKGADHWMVYSAFNAVILAYWEIFWISQRIVHIAVSGRKILELQISLHQAV